MRRVSACLGRYVADPAVKALVVRAATAEDVKPKERKKSKNLWVQVARYATMQHAAERSRKLWVCGVDCATPKATALDGLL